MDSPRAAALLGARDKILTVDNAMENTTTTYEKIGGVAAVAKLSARFYGLMDSVPQFAELRAMPPASLASSREKLYMLLSGWLGGPDLFVEKFGHPRPRGRHMPFSIGLQERDQWVALSLIHI